MRIRMNERRTGSPDGHHVYTYEAGEAYDAASTPPVDDDLAQVFVREGWAVEDAPKASPAMKRARKVTGPTEGKTDGE